MKILFIGHDAHRAGAQILLLQLLQWIKQNHSEIEFEILLGEGGDLVADYSKLSSYKIFKDYSSKNKYIRTLKKISLLKNYNKKKFDLIYCNSVVNGKILNLLKRLRVPIVTHIHELDYWINKAGISNINSIRTNSSKLIVASDAVRRCLVDNFNFNELDIETIHEFVVYDKLGQEQLGLKEKLNLPTDAIIVGASGAEIWRKGKDLFIPLAIDVLSRNNDKNIHFVWIGGGLNYELLHDFTHCEKQNNIHFIEHLPFANKYFHEFNAFAMLSREDPFPVVNLEAAGLGVPIVCFENSGGTPELVAEGCGYIVPYADIHAFADKICLLINNSVLRSEISNKSIKIVKENYDINIIANKIINVINTQNDN